MDRITASAANVVWIGLGAPKQEFWAADHQDRLPGTVLMPVGAAFDYHSGRLRRAPGWMRRVGLEWLFRLGTEPRRLAGRYVLTNARFIGLIIQEEVIRRIRPRTIRS